MYGGRSPLLPHHQPPMTTSDYQLLDGHVKSYPILSNPHIVNPHQTRVGVIQSTVVDQKVLMNHIKELELLHMQ